MGNHVREDIASHCFYICTVVGKEKMRAEILFWKEILRMFLWKVQNSRRSRGNGLDTGKNLAFFSPQGKLIHACRESSGFTPSVPKLAPLDERSGFAEERKWRVCPCVRFGKSRVCAPKFHFYFFPSLPFFVNATQFS